MSYLYNNQIDFVAKDLDSSGRLRTASPLTLFEHNNQYGTNLFKWDTATSGTGTITDNFNSYTALSTGGTASGASAIRASRRYLRYQIGKSLYGGMSVVFGAGVTNAVKQVGYYDSNNGIILQQNGTALNLVVRNTSVDTVIPQASWNVDRMDGTGPSGYTFDATKIQDFRFDFFGGLGIRFYLYTNGYFQLIHIIENANSGTFIAPATLNLTIREEIFNNGTAAGTASLNVYNANIMSEGAEDISAAYNFAASNGTTTIAVTTRRPVLTIQAKTALGANRNYGQIKAIAINLYSSSAAYFEFVVNGTLTGAAFSSVNASSIANVDTTATAISNGTLIHSVYNTPNGTGGGATGSSSLQAYNPFPYVYSSLTNTQDTLSVVATSFSGTSNCSASIVWTEYY